MEHQQVSRNKIVWTDIEFSVSPTECMRAYAYHRKDRCAALQGGRRAWGILIPRIHRYRTLVSGRRTSDVTICDACKVPVGVSAFRRLEEQGREGIEIPFGSMSRNLRTDYYRHLDTPFGR